MPYPPGLGFFHAFVELPAAASAPPNPCLSFFHGYIREND